MNFPSQFTLRFSLLSFQVPVTSWFDDMSDTELLDLIPFFESLAEVESAYAVLSHYADPAMHHNNGLSAIAT